MEVDTEKIKNEYAEACKDYYQHGSSQYNLGKMEGLSTVLIYCGLNVTEIYNIKEPFLE